MVNRNMITIYRWQWSATLNYFSNSTPQSQTDVDQPSEKKNFTKGVRCARTLIWSAVSSLMQTLNEYSEICLYKKWWIWFFSSHCLVGIVVNNNSYEAQKLQHKKCFTVINLIVQFFLPRKKNQQLFCASKSAEKKLN